MLAEGMGRLTKIRLELLNLSERHRGVVSVWNFGELVL
jgi:hypothetical protein